jgi:hypothetical protein
LWSSPNAALKSKKNGLAAGRFRLFLIARQRPIRRALAPIARAAGYPLEGRMIGSSLEHPREKIPIVGRQAEFGSIRHDPRQAVERLARHNTAPFMAPLGPGIGKQDEDPANRCRGKPCNHQPTIFNEYPDVFDAAALDPREQLCDPVFEYLATDKTDLGTTLRLLGEVLPTPKSDLNPDRPNLSAE